MSTTDIQFLLQIEPKLNKIAKLYDIQNRITTEYKTIPNPIIGTTECLKRSYIYDINNNVIGEQVRTDVWTQLMEDLTSPPITNIELDNLIINPGLSAGTKVGDIIVTGGVAPFTISLTSNPNNIFRIDNNIELTLNAPSLSGNYPIQIMVTDDDGKTATQDFIIQVISFLNLKSLQFDGVDEYVNCGLNSDIQFSKTSEFSISGWIKFGIPTLNSAVTIIGNLALNTTPRGWRIITGVNSEKNIGLQLSNSSTNQIIVHSALEYTDNNWHHFIITYDGSGLGSGINIYIDGVSVSKINFVDTLSLNISVANNLRMASTSDASPSQFFNGNLDEISIWNKVLTISEINEIYNSASPTDLLLHSATLNLLHYYRMGDDDTFPILIDNKGLNNGTCINMEALDIKSDVP